MAGPGNQRWAAVDDGIMGQTTYERVVGNAPSGDYSSMTKAELVALAEARGLATSGTKAELVARLEEADAG